MRSSPIWYRSLDLLTSEFGQKLASKYACPPFVDLSFFSLKLLQTTSKPLKSAGKYLQQICFGEGKFAAWFCPRFDCVLVKV